MSWPLGLEGAGGLAAGLLLGIAFGFLLERAGLGDPKKLTGLFYLTDFRRIIARRTPTSCSGSSAIPDWSPMTARGSSGGNREDLPVER